VAIVLAIILAWRFFSPEYKLSGKASPSESGLMRTSENAFYLDSVLTKIVGVRFTLWIANLCRWFENNVVEGVISFSTFGTRQLGLVASAMQRTNVKAYMFAMLSGVVFLLWLVLWK
jgi:NADH:ubiquinone oxidoreductase subunit 5 (subunit L)/multisubunit Na+/H+ antiporter MnhA subunit